MSTPNARRLLFRADGNAHIGLGHLVRLLAVASQLRGMAPGTFLVREPTAAIADLIATEGWAVYPLASGQSWRAEADWLGQQFLRPTDVLVLDGYDFEASYQQRLRTSGCGLVAIDDLRAWPVVADVLINHSPGVLATDYQSSATTHFLLGPEFSMLRQPFLAAATLPQSPSAIDSALVCFGGADPLRLTTRTLKALLALPQLKRIGVLIGSAFGDATALGQLVSQSQRVEVTIHSNVAAAPLVELLRTHAVAVVPASTVLIEALVLGRPALTGYYADNQRALAGYVHEHQQAFSAGNFTDLTDADLLVVLRQGLHFLATCPRQPYAARLRPELFRSEVQDLLGRLSS